MKPAAKAGKLAQEQRRDQVHGVEVFSIAAGPVGMSGTGGPATVDVVLVHGLAVSHCYLVPALRRLAANHRVFAPDLPGVGRSSRAQRQLSMAELADGLADWMAAVGVGSAAVVGHSLGCQLVAELAARYPARVSAVVLVSPAPEPDLRSLGQQA